jgi:type II secretory pathway predicted ATPase ExeA
MYESFFGLNKRPFSATPDATCCFLTKAAATAYGELRRCVEHGQGIGILTAPPGTGKTLVCRKLVAELGGRFQTAFLGTGNFSTRRALLQALLYELHQPYSGMAEQELRLEFLSAVRAFVPQFAGLLLILDEAHVLNERLLEEIRTLADLSLDGNPLVRVVLSGQLPLEERLTSSTLEAFNQRVAAQVSLDVLSRSETLEYIAYRLKWAGCETSVFSPEALDLIARACDGLPRSINQLCDHSLLLAFVADAPQVEATTVREALADLKQLPLHWNVAVLPEAREIHDAHPVSTDHDEDEEQELEAAEFETQAPETMTDAVSFEIGADVDPRADTQQASEPTILFESAAAAAPAANTTGEPVVREQDGGAEFLEFALSPLGDLGGSPAAETREKFEFAEELVSDRYAALDAGRSYIPPAAAVSAKPIAPAPPEPVELPRPAVDRQSHAAHPIARPQGEVHFRESFSVSLPALDAHRPDQLIDSLLPLVEQAQQLSVGPDIDVAPDANLEIARQFAEEQESLEEEIGSSVLELCIETQEAMSKRFDAIPETPVPLDDFPAPRLNHTIDNRPRVSRFDIVEPELPGANSQSGRAGSGAVPPPNYKMVFSLLRRRQKHRA